MARDILDVVYTTMQYALSEATDIPTGRIFFDDPDPEFINSENPTNRLPALGVFRVSSKHKPNIYGDEKQVLVSAVSGTYTVYSPAYEINGILQVNVYGRNKVEKRALNASIRNYFANNTNFATSGDVVTGEYCRILIIEEVDVYFVRPTMTAFTFSFQAREFYEHEEYIIDEIIANLQAGVNTIITTITSEGTSGTMFSLVDDGNDEYTTTWGNP